MTFIQKTMEYLPNMMYVKDWITLIAILAGPILAVQIQKYIEKRNDEKKRKVEIFKTLMATRGTVLSVFHVEALNRIDLEFSNSDKYNKVIESWKEYFDNLNTKVETIEEIAVWNGKNVELLANLLYEMGKGLGYKFEKSLIKRNWYSPMAHGAEENDNRLIRKGLIEVLEGKRNVPIEVGAIIADEEELAEQKQLRALMINYYSPKV